ncbi:unnamed protein product [Periconia digitata]|uniref:Uncharacterized protein n=1 Tax=Periconia digitata TaxID=1303443 RepID=A0A9W4UE82_9PLEO|nr:unnamed protein product [Periconia digitata]
MRAIGEDIFCCKFRLATVVVLSWRLFSGWLLINYLFKSGTAMYVVPATVMACDMVSLRMTTADVSCYELKYGTRGSAHWPL